VSISNRKQMVRRRPALLGGDDPPIPQGKRHVPCSNRVAVRLPEHKCPTRWIRVEMLTCCWLRAPPRPGGVRIARVDRPAICFGDEPEAPSSVDRLADLK